MAVSGHLRQRPFELGSRQVQRVVVNLLLGVLQRLQQQVDLAKVPIRFVPSSAFCRPADIVMASVTYPLPSSMTIDPEGTCSAISAEWAFSKAISSFVK